MGNRAANVEKDVLTTASDLTAGASYVGGGTPGKTWDVTFASRAYLATTFTVNANLGIGTLNDLDATQALVVTNNGGGGRTLTLNGGGDTVAGSAATDLIYVAANGSLTIQNGTQALNLALASNGDFDTGTGGLLSISSIVSGAFNLAKTGAGTLTLGGANTFGGAGKTFMLTGGILNINAAGALGNVSNTFVINAGTMIDNTSGAAITTGNYGVTINGDFTFVGGGTGSTHNLNLGSGNFSLGTGTGISRTITTAAANSTLTIGGSIANGSTANSVIKAGAGILIYSGTTANTYTGMTTVNAGELDLNKSAGIVAIAGGLTIGDGAGGANSDIVKLLANGQIASAAAVLINGTSGKLDINGFAQTIGSLADTGTVTAGGSSVNLGAGTLTVGNAASTTFSGAITGTGGSLVKQGIGTLALGGTNSYTGTTTISAGTLQLNAANAFPASGNLVMLGGTFDIRGQSPVIGNITFGNGTATAATNLTDSGAVKGAIKLGGNIYYNGTATNTFPPGVITANIELSAGNHSLLNPNGYFSSAASYDVIFSGVISGPGGLVKDGPVTTFWTVLNARNTYTGVTNVAAGRLYLGVANAVPSMSAVTVSAGASLILNAPVTENGVVAGNYSQNIGSLAGAGTVTLGSATLTTGNDGTSTNFSGVISGTGGLVKVGAGAQTLSGANTYTGNTIVSGGTLVAGNNLAFGAATRTVTLNGGGIASNNDTRALANPIIVTAAGGQITGSNSLTLTGAVTGGGAGSKLKVNLTDGSKTVTINPVTAGSFAPGEIEITSGTLLLGGANKVADTANLTMSGGTLKTGGFSDTLGALTLSADSNLDFGTSDNVRLQFASASWTGGTLSIANWTGSARLGNNPDQLLVTGSVSQDFLNHVSFQGFASGAIAFDRGGGLYEVVPVPEPATVLGALSVFGVIGFRERRRLVRILHPFKSGKQ